MAAERPLEIMIVEDNPGDAFLISILIEETGVPVHISISENGENAWEVLSGKDIQCDRSIPDLVIMDLNLPKIQDWRCLLE